MEYSIEVKQALLINATYGNMLLKNKGTKNGGTQFERLTQVALLSKGLTVVYDTRDCLVAGIDRFSTLIYDSGLEKGKTRELDLYIAELDTIVECKYQGPNRGTTHQKYPNVIMDVKMGEFGEQPKLFIVMHNDCEDLEEWHLSFQKHVYQEKALDSRLANVECFYGLPELLNFIK